MPIDFDDLFGKDGFSVASPGATYEQIELRMLAHYFGSAAAKIEEIERTGMLDGVPHVTYSGRYAPVRSFPLSRDTKRQLVRAMQLDPKNNTPKDVRAYIDRLNRVKTRGGLKTAAFAELYGSGNLC